MSYTVIVHITNADPVVGEIDEIPSRQDNLIILNNPRTKDGKDLPYLSNEAIQGIWPVHRISFIEIIASDQEENIFGFVRE